MKIKIITFNANNNLKAITILESLCDPSYDILLISLQEFHWIALKKLKFKGFLNQVVVNVWGTVSVILSNNPLVVQHKRGCLGSFYLGNKGYILSLINNSFVFVSAHLTHGQISNCRIKELKQIVKEIGTLGNNIPFIIAGDLNFRMDLVVDKYEEKYDQLYKLKKELDVLEHPIEFKPTYKYRDNQIDRKRIPSYCDRILFRGLRALTYESLPNITVSDHKPVFMVTKKIEFVTNFFEFPTVNYFSEVSCFVFEYFYVFILILLLLGYLILR